MARFESELRGAFLQSRKRREACLCLGLGCFFCWFWVVMQNPNTPLFHGGSRLPYPLYWPVILASATAMFAIVVAAAKRMGDVRRASLARKVSVVLLALYVAFFFVPRLVDETHEVLEFASVVVIGALAAWLFALEGAMVGALGPRKLLRCSSLSLVISFLLAALFHQFGARIASVLVSLLPFITAGLAHSLSASGWEAEGAADEERASGEQSRSLNLYVTVFVQGMAFGLLHLLYGTVVLEQCDDPYCPLRFLNTFFPLVAVGDFYGFMSIFGVALAAGVIVLSSSVLRLNFRKLIYVVGFPLMALGFLILASDTGFKMTETVSHASGVNFTAGEVVYIAGYYYVIVTTWALCSYLARTKREDRVVVFAWSGFALVAGQLLGFLTSMVAGFAAFSRADFCTAAIFLLMLTSLIITTNDGLWSEWGGVRPDEQDRPSAFKAACETIGRVHRLTPRERDVLALLARGRNMAFIAEHLCVTKDTVKTHSRSLYHKLDVHSQQELIDKVEAEIAVDRAQRLDGAGGKASWLRR